jgi:hypothetical protein
VIALAVWLLAGALLAAVPRDGSALSLVALLAGTWVFLVLVITLPTRAERAGAELTRRLAQFRHDVNGLGDRPTRTALESLLHEARTLELRDDEIASELAQVRAALAALEVAERIERDGLPIVPTDTPPAPGDVCHLTMPVRFGRRRVDQSGHLRLTTGWLEFRGTSEVSVGWGEVADVRRRGCEVIVRRYDGPGTLRFCCQTPAEAAQLGVIAESLWRAAVAGPGATGRGRSQALI